jgi:hypothetical protein
MKITNDANTTIIGSNTTVVIPNSDSITSSVVVACNNDYSYRISKEYYVALKELFKEQIGKIESNEPIIVKE